MGGKGFGVELGSVTSLKPWSPLDVSSFGEGSPWLGGQNCTSTRGMSLGSTTQTMLLSFLLCSIPVGIEMHSSFKTTVQEPIVHVLSKITFSFTESRLSRGHRSTQTCPFEHMWEILGRRARRWPHERQDINELADSLQEEWRRIPQAITGRLIRSMRRPCLACLAANGGPTRYWNFCEIDVLTLTKSQIQAKWLVKTFLLMVKVLAKYYLM